MIDPTAINAANAAPDNALSEQFIDIVFDGPPSNDSGRFIDVENAHGFSIQCGAWLQRDDGYWALRLTSDEVRKGALILQAATRDTSADVWTVIAPDGRKWQDPSIARAALRARFETGDVKEMLNNIQTALSDVPDTEPGQCVHCGHIEAATRDAPSANAESIKLVRPSTGDIFHALRNDSKGIAELLSEGWKLAPKGDGND